MAERITGPAITEFFRDGFEHTAWRLETRRAYGVPSESERYRHFLAGDLASAREPESAWVQVIRARTARGARVGRVRLVDDPPTDYQRFLLNNVTDNLAAGEDIRFMWRADAEQAGLDIRDFWLFDSRTVGVFAFDGDRSLGMALSDDPHEVFAACRVRDAAMQHAVRHKDFIAGIPSRA